MEIRRFKDGEEKEIWRLFYNTIHNVNIYDYNKNQIDAWAPEDFDIDLAIKKYREIRPFVVILEGQIVGYADIQANGYIDHFFCHHEFQGQGVGSKLFSTLEMEARNNGILSMYSNVSITARPFFEGMGFSVEKEQLVPIRGQELKNYRMVRKHEHS
jgi:putative acetyltransferase